MHYLDEGPEGDGTTCDEAVLMLHGNPTWSFYYAQLVKAVSPKLRCIGLRRVHLVVHDWGGAIGFGFAARHPELIGRIVILNTAAFRSKWIPARIALCKLPVIGPAIVRGLNGFARPALAMSMSRRALSGDERHALIFPYNSWANRVAVSGFVRDIPMNAAHPSWDTLSEVEAGLAQFQKTPALILWGGRDFCFNKRFYDEWRARLPNAEAKFYKDAGHYVLLDAAEQVIPQISEFLTRPA